MMFVSDKSTMVEVVIGANGVAPGNNSKTYFLNQPLLQSLTGGQTVFINAVETFADTDIVSSPITSGSPTATPADIINATLTLVFMGKEDQQFIPLAITRRVYGDPGAHAPWVWQPYLLQNVYAVDWTKCYIQTLAAPAAVPFSYLFQFHYSIVRTT